MRVVFLMSKDPEVEVGGDVTMSRTVMDLARDNHEVTCICLSEHDVPDAPGLLRVTKPRVSPARIAVRSLRTRRSLVHARYDTDELVRAIDGTAADVFVAEHSYMAESFLRSAQRKDRLVVNTVNPESEVWSQLHGLTGRVEGPRIRRDELRVARAASSVGSYDAEEVQELRDNGVPRAFWLDVTLPPAEPYAVSQTLPRLVFVGVRDWPPNLRAARLLCRWWPQISGGVPGAELIIVGARGRGDHDLSEGSIRDLGRVDDLDRVLSGCRAMAAPIEVGGGVRVKVLEAAAHGLPVVTTSSGIGSLSAILPLVAYDDPGSFVTRCRELLLSADEAAADGERLHQANADHWDQKRPQAAVQRWLAG